MDALARLKLLSGQMALEAENDTKPTCFTPQKILTRKQVEETFIHPAKRPDGKPMRLLKTLLTSACERDCYYCPFRAGRDMRRATFKPGEFASLFMTLHHARAVDGLFISSGVAGGGVRSQDRLLDTVEIIRHKMAFRGYIHLKMMPGSEKDQVLRAMQLSDRVSVNLEAPNTERLALLAPHKQFIEELLQPLQWAEEIRTEQPTHLHWKGRWPSTVTQFVAGGADESDLELLTTTDWLHRHVRLTRVYFSAFSPIENTPLENNPPTDPLREHRLYQASYLLRDYGFDLEELPFTGDGNLPLPSDPKQAWAELHLKENPLEINTAERAQLLRVPGIGPKSAERIITARRIKRLRDLGSLRKIGVNPERAAAFVLLDGHRAAQQPQLFSIIPQTYPSKQD